MRRPIALALLIAAALSAPATAQPYEPLVPHYQRGTIDAERVGNHDAANIRTRFWNFGMVGDYPVDPGNVDLSLFHSAEVPKGSGMNYTDGITPFVLAKVTQTTGLVSYIMETGYRERQAISPATNNVMRFEPRMGYIQPKANVNLARSPAISTDPRTWPPSWPDKADDPTDPGWPGSWNGYFGKRPAADQESYTVMDDNFYDAWDYYPDNRAPCCDTTTRYGLGLRVEVRGFQWSNPQAGNVIFWHYDIVNEGTTDYDNNIIFGLYMDSGVGGSQLSCDGVFESDDDNAYWDKSFPGLNLVYTWDVYGHGVDLTSTCAPTGYLGYAYLETPGDPFDGIDNDGDGITDEVRDGGPGTLIVGQDAIRAYVASHYDTTKFQAYYGPLEKRPAFKAGRWWTGDEDLDWVAEFDDVGADGLPDTHDLGEGDGIPTEGEPDFDRTDKDESDQIGLTGFKMSRIRAGLGNPDPTTDNVLFYTDSQNWPERLFDKFTDPFVPARFDSAVAANYNIAFLFASGPFVLKAGKRERFSLALAFGNDLQELRENVHTVQLIYNANYQFAVPPQMPVVSAETGDGWVRLSWNDLAERSVDPVTRTFDFEGYRIYRSTDPEFRDPKVITTGRGNPSTLNGVPIAQFDLADGIKGYSRKTIDGVAYYLGNDTGITHTWTDSTVTNGQQYYYAVCAYDFGYDPGADSLAIYPSENAIAVTGTARGGFILPANVVAARPEPRVAGFEPGDAAAPSHVAGRGTGTVSVRVVNSNLVPSGHNLRIVLRAPSPDSVRATRYSLMDSTSGLPSSAMVLFSQGADLDGVGIGPVADGLLPVVRTPLVTTVDTARSGWAPGFHTNVRLSFDYEPPLSANFRRPGYPDDITITFDSTFVDTTLPGALADSIPFPIKFRITASDSGRDLRLRCYFPRDRDHDGTLSRADEFIDVVSYLPGTMDPQKTWRVKLDTTGVGAAPIVKPTAGDVWHMRVAVPFETGDVFAFRTIGQRVAPALAAVQSRAEPYVVPNPYVGSASFEPNRFAVSGRGERRIEFRAIPLGGVIRIYTVHGDLVQTLRQDGSTAGMVPWNLRTKDNLDLAPGLYIFQVEAPGAESHTGKFAVIK